MRLLFPFARSMNTWSLLRRLGYSPDRRTGFPAGRSAPQEASYQRRLGRSVYPRFHIYVNEDTPDRLVINLHADMKKPSYSGTHAHAGEYDGDLIEREAERIEHFVSAVQNSSHG